MLGRSELYPHPELTARIVDRGNIGLGILWVVSLPPEVLNHPNVNVQHDYRERAESKILFSDNAFILFVGILAYVKNSQYFIRHKCSTQVY